MKKCSDTFFLSNRPKKTWLDVAAICPKPTILHFSHKASKHPHLMKPVPLTHAGAGGGRKMVSMILFSPLTKQFINLSHEIAKGMEPV